jgi:hypothetical protein
MNSITKFKQAQTELLKERDRLAKELQAINTALNGHGLAQPAHVVGVNKMVRQRNRTARNQPSLASVVEQVTAKRALTKQEILDAVKRAGYVFATKDPMNSLNAMLYSSGRNRFKNVGGKFSPVK